MNDYKEKHIYTPEFKKKHLGDGIWCNEPDEITFTYKDYECKVLRIIVREPYAKEECYFGGHLCGYIRISSDHPYNHKKYEDIDVDCHYGLTYSKEEKDGYWIGFDCAHSSDLVPSMKLFIEKYKDELLEKIFPVPEEFKNLAIFNPSYKEINFAIDECKSIVDQLLEIANETQVQS